MESGKQSGKKGFEIGGLMEIRGEGFAESLGKVVKSIRFGTIAERNEGIFSFDI